MDGMDLIESGAIQSGFFFHWKQQDGASRKAFAVRI
jgi:hypothetical protein